MLLPDILRLFAYFANGCSLARPGFELANRRKQVTGEELCCKQLAFDGGRQPAAFTLSGNVHAMKRNAIVSENPEDCHLDEPYPERVS